MKKKKELKEQLKASESLVRDLAILNNKHGARAVEYAAELAQLREQLAAEQRAHRDNRFVAGLKRDGIFPPDTLSRAEVRRLLAEGQGGVVSLAAWLNEFANESVDSIVKYIANWQEGAKGHHARLSTFLARHPEPTAGESEPPKVDDCDTAKALQKITTHAWVVTVTEPKADPLATYNQHYADLKAKEPAPVSLPWPLNGEWGPANKIDREGKFEVKGTNWEAERFVVEDDGVLRSYDQECVFMHIVKDYHPVVTARYKGPLPSAEGEGA